MGLMVVVTVLVIASMFSVYKLGPDNAIEKEADALINKELGTNINFDEIIDDIEMLKKPATTVPQGTDGK